MLTGKRILLIVGGGIAAYKSLDLVRRLREAGASVTPVLTDGGAQFVTPLSLSALAGAKVYRDLFDLTDEAEMGRIQLSRSADLVLVAPATADLMARMAAGSAGDLAATLLLATDTPVLMAPSMNVRMWEHPATRRNLATLRGDGIAVVGPNEGAMACGEYGPGRMAEVPQIVAAVATALRAGALAGRHVLVTSGPTHEPIDPVRYIANRSSGAQGTAIAAACAALGARVSFVTGPAAVPPPEGVEVARVETAAEMLKAVTGRLPADAAVFAAAVADWHVAQPSRGKLKKVAGAAPRPIELAENPDILATVSRLNADRPRLVIGFAAETDDVVARATAKRARKGCDWILANDVSPETGIMGGANNTVTLITEAGAESWPSLPKRVVAERLADRIAGALA